jgi:hypothetical protein
MTSFLEAASDGRIGVCIRCRSYSLSSRGTSIGGTFLVQEEASIDKKSRSFLTQRFVVV